MLQWTRRVTVPAQSWVRGYAVSVDPSRVYEGKAVPRRYAERKSFLYSHTKNSTQRKLQLLRREIEAASSKFAPSPTLQTTTPAAVPPKLTIHAHQLNAIIRAIDRTVPPKKAVQEDAGKGKHRKDDDADFIPGRPRPRIKPDLTPELKVMGALIEGRVFTAPAVRDVAQLPTLDTLRAQIVGLLSFAGHATSSHSQEAGEDIGGLEEGT
ncbi:hypothetical protein BKA83DRAFT_87756 [Pisolithus microcarpus]|nr:hypothetical protein BKA83DRAFT_87756 [Pisolithus microcarpus]